MRLRSAAVLAFTALAAFAQDQQVFRSDTHLLEVQVVVRNGKGPVDGLTERDFQLFDNEKPQEIRSFGIARAGRARMNAGHEPNGVSLTAGENTDTLPVTATVLFINNLAIAFADQIQAQRRIGEIVKTLPPHEPIAIYKLNFNFVRALDFTEDRFQVAKVLAQAPGEQAQPRGFTWIPPAYPAIEAIANQVATWPGRKNLIWLANFFPVADKKTNPIAWFAMMKTLQALNAANVAVYPVAARGVFGPPVYSADRGKAPPLAAGRNLSQPPGSEDGMFWAAETGGNPAANTDIGIAVQRAIEDSDVTYTLGFYPEILDGAYHKLNVKVERRGVEVRARKGYVAAQ
jgi:VWFA-related protein